MTLVADRVQETSTTTGTGTLTLAGASTGFRTFTAAFGNGASVYYVIAGGSEYEIGIGTTGAGTLSRDTVLQSSNAGALVPLSGGLKDVFCAYVAERAVTTSDASTLTNKTIDDYTNNVGANSTHFRVKASGAIAKGSVVKAVGFTPGEQAIEVALVASASDVAIGITEQVLTSGQFGMAVVIGELFNVNTAGYTINDTIYNNGAGGFTATKPSSGTYQTLGTIVRVNTNNGVIAVNVVSPLYVEASTSTANTVVLRDGSANFAAGTITAALTGNANTATALQTARAINGVNFDGTAAITVPAAAGTLTGATLAAGVTASSLTSVGTLAGLTVTAPIAGSVTGSSGSTTGNAATATALQTGRAINGVTFDGTAPITVTAAAGTLSGTTLSAGVTASSLTSVGTLGSLTVTNPITGSVTGSSGSTTGNAATATALQTARTINGTSFNGTANITVTADASTLTSATLASGVTASSLTSVGTLATLTTSGTTSLATAAGALSVRNVAYTFPAAQGAASTLLTNNGSGTLTWATASAPAQTIVSTATTYTLSAADVGKQIIYTGTTDANFFYAPASLASGMTTGQTIDLLNSSAYRIKLGGSQVFTTYSQGTVTSNVTIIKPYSNGKLLIVYGGNTLARFNADGTVDNTFTIQTANGTINDLTLNAAESLIYVCGNFTTWNTPSTVSRYGLARLNATTGLIDGWAPYPQSGSASITSIAINGSVIACASWYGTTPQFFDTNGTEIASAWRQNSGEANTYASISGAQLKAHPTLANTFINFSNGYIYTDGDLNEYSSTSAVFHIQTSGVPFTYSTSQPAGSIQAKLIISPYIYSAVVSGSNTQLYRQTIGSTNSTASGGVYTNGMSPISLWRRASDNTFWAGGIGNFNSGIQTTAVVGWDSGLTALPQIVIYTYDNRSIHGATLSDNSFLLSSAYNAGSTNLARTVPSLEPGATIAYPPQSTGNTSFTTTQSQTNFAGYRTFKLQKMANGFLQIVESNTPFGA